MEGRPHTATPAGRRAWFRAWRPEERGTDGRSDQDPPPASQPSAVGSARALGFARPSVGRVSPPSPSLPIPSGGHGVAEASVLGRSRRRLQLTNGDNNVYSPGRNEMRDFNGWLAEGARRWLFMVKKTNNNKPHKDADTRKIERNNKRVVHGPRWR